MSGDTPDLAQALLDSIRRCPLCGGIGGAHGMVHTRHGNGGGSNTPCPNSTATGAES